MAAWASSMVIDCEMICCGTWWQAQRLEKAMHASACLLRDACKLWAYGKFKQCNPCRELVQHSCAAVDSMQRRQRLLQCPGAAQAGHYKLAYDASRMYRQWPSASELPALQGVRQTIRSRGDPRQQSVSTPLPAYLPHALQPKAHGPIISAAAVPGAAAACCAPGRAAACLPQSPGAASPPAPSLPQTCC